MSEKSDPTPVERVQQRLRLIAEPLLTNSTLRDELDDAQAQALYDWALHVLEETAVSTADLPDTEAEPILEEKGTAVQLIMRLINELVANPTLLPDEDIINTRLVRLGKNVQWLSGGPDNPIRRRFLREFRRQRDRLDRHAAFQLLLSALQAPEEEHDT